MHRSKNGGHADDSNDENGRETSPAAVATAPCAPPRSPTTSSSSSSFSRCSHMKSQRLGMILCLSLAVAFLYQSPLGGLIAVTIATSDRGVAEQTTRRYEPLLIGKGGGDRSDDDDNHDEAPQRLSFSVRHPRIACLPDGQKKSLYNCESFIQNDNDAIRHIPSIPRIEMDKGGKVSGGGKTSSSDVMDVNEGETEECKLSDPTYQLRPAAPSTCNDVHSLPFRFGPTANEPAFGKGGGRTYLSQHRTSYLTSGGFRAVWTVTRLDGSNNDSDDDDDEPPVRSVMKTNRMGRGWGSHYMDQNRRDILVSERAGSRPDAHSNNVLSIYHYCAFSSVVPYSTAGPLANYVEDRVEEGRWMTAAEIFLLGLQAARGLHQMGLYRDGRATHVHADVKPPQFLLFDRRHATDERRLRGGENETSETEAEAWDDVPVLQINDFNRGRFLARSITTNATCPFRMCHVHHKGSKYRSPEEYMDCADQSDKIDVFSLAGVFFFLLSDGSKPWYHVKDYDASVERILRGEKPRLPRAKEYEYYGKSVAEMVRERAKDPAYVALREVMTRCWAFEPAERPSSLEVVQMLEERWEEIRKARRRQQGGEGERV